jgi:AraC-like DNA-binding protein
MLPRGSWRCQVDTLYEVIFHFHGVIADVISQALFDAGWIVQERDGKTIAGKQPLPFLPGQNRVRLERIIHAKFSFLHIEGAIVKAVPLAIHASGRDKCIYVQTKGVVLFVNGANSLRVVSLQYGVMDAGHGIFHLQFQPGAVAGFLIEPIGEMIQLPGSASTIFNTPHASFYFYLIGVMDQHGRHLIRQMQHATLALPELNLYREAKWLELLSRICVQLRAGQRQKGKRMEIITKADIEKYIQLSLNEPTGVKAIASHFHMSISAFKKKFRKLFNNSIHRYILEQKYAHARQLLEQGSISIYGVALQSGFSDPSHFIKQFRKRYGITPLRYRKERRK